MTVAIRHLSSSLTQQGTRLLSNAAKLSPYFSPSRGVERFTPQIAELGLGGVLAMAYLYQRGRALRDNDSTNDNRWMFAMGEGMTTQAILQNVKMGVPGLGLGWTAYEMGMVKGPMEKIKTALRGAVLFPLGCVGILMGLGVTDGLRHRDAMQVQQMLGQMEKQIKQNAAGNALLTQAEAVLKPEVDLMKARIKNLVALYNISGPKLAKVPEATALFLESQQGFIEKLAKLPAQQIEAIEGIGRPLISRLRNASLYPVVRLLNPTFGYLLAVTFVGLPLVKLISDYALPKGQHSEAFTLGHNVAPLWFDRAVNKAFPMAGVGGHGAEGGHSVYTSGNGPAIIAANSGGGHGSGH